MSTILYIWTPVKNCFSIKISKIYICKNLKFVRKFYATNYDYKFNSNNVKSLPDGWGKKVHLDKRKIKINPLNEKFNSQAKIQLEPLKTNVKTQSIKVKNLKKDGYGEDIIMKEVKLLKKYKKELEDAIFKLCPTEIFDRARMNDLVKRKFIHDISFEIYGGIAGQYDFGPLGCGIVENIISEWNNHFVLKEKMLKVNCSVLTPDYVLKASGHVDKFSDFLVKDRKTGESFRLDHIIKQTFKNRIDDKKTNVEDKVNMKKKLDILDGMSMTDLNNIVKEENIKSPEGNDLTPVSEFNLMFPISFGAIGNIKGYLRPETAQNIFLNFKKLYYFNQRKLPFACAQVGTCFRNEISPKTGLLRLREFILAEIEHFCHPENKKHNKFYLVKDVGVWLFSACDQLDGNSERYITIGEAVKEGLVANETLGYYMARIQQFMIKIGINPAKLRFRQHMSNEMAHYACDCWDAECLTSYGWIECVGCADRSTYDLTQHSNASGVNLIFESRLSKPKTVKSLKPILNRNNIVNEFGDDANIVLEKLSCMKDDQVQTMENSLSKIGEYTLDGRFKLTRSTIPVVKLEEKEIHVEEITPNVIEPSFGIGRIFYSLLEHTFRIRETDENRSFFSLPPKIAAIKVALLPLVNKADFSDFILQLDQEMTDLKIALRIDDSKDSIGRRYTRADELSIPFAITVDFDTVKDDPHTVTIRDRDSTEQLRIPIADAPKIILQLSEGRISWKNLTEKYPKFIFKN